MSEQNFLTYEDMQEALRLTAEASDAQVTVPTSAGPYKVDLQPLALAFVQNLAASLKHVRIQERKPFRGQTYADMAVTHTEHAAQLLRIARGTNDLQELLRTLMDANDHLEEARQMLGRCAVKVNEELKHHPGDAVKLCGDEFDVVGKRL